MELDDDDVDDVDDVDDEYSNHGDDKYEEKFYTYSSFSSSS